MSAFFITAIGTGVGKTFLTAALTHQLQAAGRPVRAIKPVVSGCDIGDDDSAILANIQNEPDMHAISPWRFTAPLSPHLAAAQEGREINTMQLNDFCRQEAQRHPLLLCEGVGGVMVPLTPDFLVRDWMKALGWPVLLVASDYLGAINHTLLTLEALDKAGLSVQALVISAAEHGAGLAQTAESIRPFLPQQCKLALIPRLPCRDSAWQNAPSLLSLLS